MILLHLLLHSRQTDVIAFVNRLVVAVLISLLTDRKFGETLFRLPRGETLTDADPKRSASARQSSPLIGNKPMSHVETRRPKLVAGSL
jgi:hypothetical protein